VIAYQLNITWDLFSFGEASLCRNMLDIKGALQSARRMVTSYQASINYA